MGQKTKVKRIKEQKKKRGRDEDQGMETIEAVEYTIVPFKQKKLTTNRVVSGVCMGVENECCSGG